MIQYENMMRGRFLARPNRFLAYVEINGREEICHVKNTGRCRELLLPGVTVWCQHHDDARRKTAWSLITVQKGEQLVNLDSQIPNRLAFDYVKNGGLGFVPTVVKAEQVYKESRFDLYYEAGERRGFVEVKGVTLEEDGVARFPDAPTERGRKHLRELQGAVTEGYEAWVLFVVQMEAVRKLEPNRRRDPAFADALAEAAGHGVHVRAVRCRVTPDTLRIIGEIPAESC